MINKLDKMVNKVFNRLKAEHPEFDLKEAFQAVDEAVNVAHSDEVETYQKLLKEGRKYCSRCGSCCERLNINLNINDVKRLNKVVGLKGNLQLNGTSFQFAQKPCIYLSENGLCKIYNDRPSSCKNHPISNPDKPRIMRDPDCDYTIGFFMDKAISIMIANQAKNEDKDVDVED